MKNEINGLIYFLFFLLKAATPTNPEPKRRRVLGSGTAALA